MESIIEFIAIFPNLYWAICGLVVTGFVIVGAVCLVWDSLGSKKK